MAARRLLRLPGADRAAFYVCDVRNGQTECSGLHESSYGLVGFPEYIRRIFSLPACLLELCPLTSVFMTLLKRLVKGQRLGPARFSHRLGASEAASPAPPGGVYVCVCTRARVCSCLDEIARKGVEALQMCAGDSLYSAILHKALVGKYVARSSLAVPQRISTLLRK
eukprot:1160450-Pelagomonas_calceolata.AAC.19